MFEVDTLDFDHSLWILKSIDWHRARPKHRCGDIYRQV